MNRTVPHKKTKLYPAPCHNLYKQPYDKQISDSSNFAVAISAKRDIHTL